MENTAPNLPTLGQVKFEVRQFANTWTVFVSVFKANSLRGDAYWVSTEVRKYKKESDARKFAARFN
jgi:hypothetical protein